MLYIVHDHYSVYIIEVCYVIVMFTEHPDYNISLHALRTWALVVYIETLYTEHASPYGMTYNSIMHSCCVACTTKTLWHGAATKLWVCNIVIIITAAHQLRFTIEYRFIVTLRMIVSVLCAHFGNNRCTYMIILFIHYIIVFTNTWCTHVA